MNYIINLYHLDVKQLAWEENRNRWLKGFNKAVGGMKSDKFANKRKPMANKRPNPNKTGNKRKKMKK